MPARPACDVRSMPVRSMRTSCFECSKHAASTALQPHPLWRGRRCMPGHHHGRSSHTPPQQNVACCAGKYFTQEKGCEKILFGHDDVADRDSGHPGEVRRKQRQADGTPEDGFSIEHIGRLIIVEGELDKLACNEVLVPLPGEVFW